MITARPVAGEVDIMKGAEVSREHLGEWHWPDRVGLTTGGHAQGDLGPLAVQATDDAVHPASRLVPVVGGREVGSHCVVGVHFNDGVGDGCRAHRTPGCLLRLPVAGARLVELRLDQRVRSGRRDKQLAVGWLTGDDRKQDLVRNGRAGALDECVPEAGVDRLVPERDTHGYHRQVGNNCTGKADSDSQVGRGRGEIQAGAVEHDGGYQAELRGWAGVRDNGVRSAVA